MAAPNLKSLTSAIIDSKVLVPTTTYADLYAAVATGHALSVEAIFATNVHATKVAKVSVVVTQGGTDYLIAHERTVATRTTINVILGRPVYLAEGDSIRVKTFEDTTAEVVSPYMDMS